MVTDNVRRLSLEEGPSVVGTVIAGEEDEAAAAAACQVRLPHLSSNDDQASTSTSIRPVFHPPLWLARRTACIKALKKEGVRSVVDLGCGSGAVLSMLTSPAYHLDSFPDLYAPDPVPHSINSSSFSLAHEVKVEQLRKVPRLRPEEEELHLRRVIGVDVDRVSLLKAAQVTDPKAGKMGGYEPQRWEELRVELYEGGLESYNQALEGIEAMIATEVIEHLPPQLFDKFASTILGVYQPRLVVVTTPNHEFNPYFITTSKQDEDSNRFPDPTGRTHRVFRDDDHQFEFTIDEFQTWARSIAAEHDYEVAFSGVGSLANYYSSYSAPYSAIPNPPPSLSSHPACIDFPSSRLIPSDPKTFFATQIATFKRIFPNEVERSPRSHRPQPLPFFSSPTMGQAIALSSPSSEAAPPSPSGSTSNPRPRLTPRKSTSPTPHIHLKTHFYATHPSASQPVAPNRLLETLRSVFNERHASILSLGDVWAIEKMRIDCGGLVGSLIEALVEEEEGGEWGFEAIVDGDQKRGLDALLIEWKKEGQEAERNGHVDEDEEEEEQAGSGEMDGEELDGQSLDLEP